MAKNQVRLDIQRRELFAGGVSFGDTGPYERLFGNAHFAIDPAEAGLPSIVDLDLAPRNASGLVEFSATLDIVKPVEIARGRRRVLYEFSNRGNRGLLGFNYGRGTALANGTLVTAEEVLTRYPKVEGVNLPKGPSRLPRYDYHPGGLRAPMAIQAVSRALPSPTS